MNTSMNMSMGSTTLYSACPCDNMSGYNRALQAALLAAENVGIVTFASSGNSGSTTQMTSPACLTSAVAVAAAKEPAQARTQSITASLP